MKTALSIVLSLLSFVLFAQNNYSPNWELKLQGSAESRIKKIVSDQNNTIVALAGFRRGDLIVNGQNYSEVPGIDNHRLFHLDSAGTINWVSEPANFASDFLLTGSSVYLPATDTLYKLNKVDGQPEWKISASSNSTLRVNFNQIEELQNGSLLIQGNAYGDQFSFGDSTIVRSNSAYFLFLIQVDVNGNLLQYFEYDFIGMPSLTETKMIASEGFIFLSFRSDSIADLQAGNSLVFDAGSPVNPVKSTLVCFNENLSAIWTKTFSGDSANFQISNLLHYNGMLLQNGNVYSAFGNSGPFELYSDTDTLANTCAGSAYSRSGIFMNETNGTQLAQWEEIFYCQGNILSIQTHQYGINFQELISYQNALNWSGRNFHVASDTALDGTVYNPSVILQYDNNGMVVDAIDYPYFAGIGFGDFQMNNEGFIASGIYLDSAGGMGKIPKGVISYQQKTNVGIEEQNKISLSVFPNPTTGELRWNADFRVESIELYSAEGKQILLSGNALSSSVLQLEHLEKGIYFLRWSSGELSGTEKIILF